MKEFGDFERPRNEGEHQYILAEELFTRDFPSEAVRIDDTGFKNRMMEYWIEDRDGRNGHSYAGAFRGVVEHPDFKKHDRFRRSSLNVTLSDVEYFFHNNELPER